MRLQTLTHEEIYVLLTRLADVHTTHYGYAGQLSHLDYQDFMEEAVRRLGAEELLTPREVVRDFISLLNLVRQNTGVSFAQLVHGSEFQPTRPAQDPDSANHGQFAEFTL